MTIREAVARIGSHAKGTFLHKHAMNVILRAYKKHNHFVGIVLDEDDDIYEDARRWATN